MACRQGSSGLDCSWAPAIQESTKIAGGGRGARRLAGLQAEANRRKAAAMCSSCRYSHMCALQHCWRLPQTSSIHHQTLQRDDRVLQEISSCELRSGGRNGRSTSKRSHRTDEGGLRCRWECRQGKWCLAAADSSPPAAEVPAGPYGLTCCHRHQPQLSTGGLWRKHMCPCPALPRRYRLQLPAAHL